MGDIDDEHDVDEDVSIRALGDGAHSVQALTPIEDFNEHFGTTLSDEEFDTIGGLVAHEHGRVPRRGETVDVGPLRFQVMLTRGGAVRWFRVTRRPADELLGEGDAG